MVGYKTIEILFHIGSCSEIEIKCQDREICTYIQFIFCNLEHWNIVSSSLETQTCVAVLPLSHLTLMIMVSWHHPDALMTNWWLLHCVTLLSVPSCHPGALTSVMQIVLVNPSDRYPHYWGPPGRSHADPWPCESASDQQVPPLSSSYWPVLIFIRATVIIRIICLTLWSRAL